MTRHIPHLTLALIALAVAVPGLAGAAELPAAGVLRTVGGGPIADGSYTFSFRLYDAADAKVFLWEESQDVATQGGWFSATLGIVAGKPLSDALLTSGKPLWLAVKVGADPELPRAPLGAVSHAYHAKVANGLACSGCIGTDHLADGSVTGAKVAFAYAGSDSKGGPAKEAIVALTAKTAETAVSADKATTADTAKVALVAKNADKAASADEAASAKVADKLSCTGCVTAAMIDPKAILPMALKTDLAGYGALAGDNAWKGKNAFAGIDLGYTEATSFRLQNAAKSPLACDAAHAGLVYFNTADQSLYLCNGTDWFSIATVATLGSESKPAATCKAILAAGASKGSGLYWLDVDGPGGSAGKVQAWCDMTTDGGGWTRLLACLPKDDCKVAGSERLYTLPWTTSDVGVTAGEGASYLQGKALAPVVAGATEFLVTIEHTSKGTTGHLKYGLNANTVLWFNGSGFFQSGDVGWTRIDWDGSKSTHASKICYVSNTNPPVRSIQGINNLTFLEETTTSPSASAGGSCDYGAWTSQILIRGGTDGLSANFGAGPSANWAAQPYAHRVLVR